MISILNHYEALFALPENFANYDLADEMIPRIHDAAIEEEDWGTPDLCGVLDTYPNVKREFFFWAALNHLSY